MSKFTLPKQLKKKFRKIVVNDTMYAWKIGESLPAGYGFGITIMHIDSKSTIGALIEKRANYLIGYDSKGNKSGTRVLPEILTITPAFVRKLILYGIDQGWKYKSNISIDVNAEIPFSNHVEFNFPKLVSEQVVVVAYKRTVNQTLIVLDKDLKEFIGLKSFYKVLSNQKEAESYMLNESSIHNQIEFWMIKNIDKAIAKVESGEIIYFKN